MRRRSGAGASSSLLHLRACSLLPRRLRPQRPLPLLKWPLNPLPKLQPPVEAAASVTGNIHVSDPADGLEGKDRDD
jgi:hypothetical protein